MRGVSAWRLVLATAAAEPTWSWKDFSPVTDSFETASLNSEPICWDKS